MASNRNCFSVDEARKLITDHRYIIDEYVGAGAMSCVYKARERGTPNVYALKILRDKYRRREKFKEIFKREAEYMRDLQYPNIVRFYKFVDDEDSAYIIMDYVEGKALTGYIQDIQRTGKPLALDKVVRIMAQIARAINYVHTEGYMHRDVKPGNVLLVGESESAFLTDLGIAGAIDEQATGGAGTPSYMPYEQQIRGDVGPSADTYAFAIMMYELFTGEKPFVPDPSLPFEEAREVIVEMHRSYPVPSLHAKRPDLPPVLDTFFEQALAKNPAARYPDILDFARDIHEALRPFLSEDMQNFDNIQAQSPDKSRDEVLADSVPPPVNNWVIFGGIGAIIVIALLVAGGIWFNNQNSGVVSTPTDVVAETATAIPPTASLTPTTPPTFTPEPTSFLSGVTVIPLAEGVDVIGYGDDLTRSVHYIAGIRDGFVPLLSGRDLNGFRVVLSVDGISAEDDVQYGLAFRIQDEDNYLLFTVDSGAMAWTLSLVQDANAMSLQSGAIADDIPLDLVLSAEDDLIRIELGDSLIEQLQTTWDSGSVALWMPATSVTVSHLEIGLIGDENLGDDGIVSIPILQFLLDDLQAILASGDQNSIVDCSQFAPLYDRLDNHAGVDGAGAIISDVRLSSTVIFASCNLERDNTSVEFSFSDYLNWETGLGSIIADLQERTETGE